MDSDFLRLARRVKDAEEAAKGYLLKRGGVMTGSLTAPGLILDAAGTPAGTAEREKGVYFRTGGRNRWSVASNSADESGGNRGSNFAIARYDDNGNLIDAPFSISRETGIAAFTQAPRINAGYVWHQGTLPIEQGSWTPVIIGTTNWVAAVTSQASGKYVRIGNMIHVYGGIVISSVNGMAGNVAVANLPMVCQLSSAGTVGLAGGVINSPLLSLHIDRGSSITYVIGGSQYIIQATGISDSFGLWSFHISYAVA